jgi:hypothetical protein
MSIDENALLDRLMQRHPELRRRRCRVPESDILEYLNTVHEVIVTWRRDRGQIDVHRCLPKTAATWDLTPWCWGDEKVLSLESPGLEGELQTLLDEFVELARAQAKEKDPRFPDWWLEMDKYRDERGRWVVTDHFEGKVMSRLRWHHSPLIRCRGGLCFRLTEYRILMTVQSGRGLLVMDVRAPRPGNGTGDDIREAPGTERSFELGDPELLAKLEDLAAEFVVQCLAWEAATDAGG